MVIRYFMHALVFTQLFLAMSCSNDTREAVPATSLSSVTQSWQSVITNGADIADLVRAFGPPVSERVLDQIKVSTFIFANAYHQSNVVGAMVDSKDGKVQRHTPITGDRLPFEWDPRASRETPAPPLLVRGGKSEITLNPLMIAPTEIVEGDERIVKRAIVDLSEDEAKRFSTFTEANRNTKVEVFLGETHLSEFYIAERIDGNEFELRIPQGVRLERLFSPK